ncbi:beta-N-acetylhexosaminidase [Paenibacillus koleovorans]|uniref:beta-N-acetylhexosaminidase n=1 Tax=Paenibacillus koleovorans TaxID=121608 RepID=UPI000FD9D56C|nr:beta-N-acetylhexosaminidase [Paenibacillus koleovorans]
MVAKGNEGELQQTGAGTGVDLAGWSLRRKIGQMLQCGFDGTIPNEDILKLIREHAIGGVILFARNVSSAVQVAEMNAALQKAALESGGEPLWISIDQEGGMVARLIEGVALMPGNMALSAGGTAEQSYQASRVAGEELRALGINLNFAPVLDVNNNANNPVIGVRSYGESPDRVGDFGLAAIRGLQEAGIAAAAKHFPGHGDTDVDSHLDLPKIKHDRERIYSVELPPFVRAIQGGVDSIMSSHVYFPAFEPDGLPATLSRRVLTGLLREELGYDGVIMTDCMEMNAIAGHYGTVNAAVMAVEAGADMVLLSHRHDLQYGAVEALVAAVESGRIAEARIDASVQRLLALKAKRGVTAAAVAARAAAPTAGEAFARVGGREHMALAQSLSEASVTCVRAAEGALPLRAAGDGAGRTLALVMQPAVVTQVDEALEAPMTLGRALQAQGLAAVDERVLAPAELEGRVDELAALAAGGAYDQVVIATYNAAFFPAQGELVRRVMALGKQPIVVAQRNPYDLLQFPDVPTFVAIYESRSLALQSAAKFLTGRIPAAGKLPVSIGSLYRAEAGRV